MGRFAAELRAAGVVVRGGVEDEAQAEDLRGEVGRVGAAGGAAADLRRVAPGAAAEDVRETDADANANEIKTDAAPAVEAGEKVTAPETVPQA